MRKGSEAGSHSREVRAGRAHFEKGVRRRHNGPYRTYGQSDPLGSGGPLTLPERAGTSLKHIHTIKRNKSTLLEGSDEQFRSLRWKLTSPTRNNNDEQNDEKNTPKV
ncbi:hypothetical protein AVEN_117752-1 [Araneus ventricosus]|uniref:Uncharacterized protein n=1 Tax=Araneus ventricosus TaxID=182803 RepID=A0A4Y2B9R7_ARAVE|nr:hypothetical protein AVEN_117752-1 [Araneus ventricosus]